MIFKQWQQVLNRSKTQTRRLVQPGDAGTGYRWKDGAWLEIDRVRSATGRIKWRTGTPWSYAVQPGRGKKTKGRIRILSIYKQFLQDIDASDCIAEGLHHYDDQGISKTELDLIEEYAALWDSIHRVPGTLFRDNPEVWVLTFELEAT